MNVKTSAAGLIIATSLIAAVGTAQATVCVKHPSGWHMVSKSCNIKPAENWQQYASGIYTQPTSGKSLFLVGTLMNH